MLMQRIPLKLINQWLMSHDTLLCAQISDVPDDIISRDASGLTREPAKLSLYAGLHNSPLVSLTIR